MSAQLQGGGNIQDSVSSEVVTKWSNGTYVTHDVQVLAHAHASGGYNIANAEYVPTGF